MILTRSLNVQELLKSQVVSDQRPVELGAKASCLQRAPTGASIVVYGLFGGQSPASLQARCLRSQLHLAGAAKRPRTVSGLGGHSINLPESAFLQIASPTRKRPASSVEPARGVVLR